MFLHFVRRFHHGLRDQRRQRSARALWLRGGRSQLRRQHDCAGRSFRHLAGQLFVDCPARFAKLHVRGADLHRARQRFAGTHRSAPVFPRRSRRPPIGILIAWPSVQRSIHRHHHFLARAIPRAAADAARSLLHAAADLWRSSGRPSRAAGRCPAGVPHHRSARPDRAGHGSAAGRHSADTAPGGNDAADHCARGRSAAGAAADQNQLVLRLRRRHLLHPRRRNRQPAAGAVGRQRARRKATCC